MPEKFRFYLAHWGGKLIRLMMRLLKRNATYLPGTIALKLDPNYLKHVGKPKHVIAVSGTNGKTTVSNMIGDQLELLGKSFMHNRYGSNTHEGIVSALLQCSDWGGKVSEEYGVLEIDERSALKIFAGLTPEYMVMTNLFRDSYARNAHADYIFEIMNRAVPDGVHMVLNADDLISAALKPNNPRVYFSVPLLDGEVEDRHSRIRDLVNCPQCHHELEPDFIRYNHIGRYHCPECGFRSPEAKYQVEEADLQAGCAVITDGDSEARFKLSTPNIVDVYNVLTSVAVLRECGFELETLAENSQKIKVVKSRFNDERVGGKRVFTMLAKACNPIASSRTFDFLRKEPGKKCVVLANSEKKHGYHNSENTAWIYDNDFSYLNDENIMQVICCGKRYLDFALCVSLAGVPEERITLEENFDRVPGVIRYDKVDTICILKDLDTEDIAEKMAETVKAKLKGGLR